MNLGGVEAGGTKIVCGVGTGPENLRRETFPTSSPRETIAQIAEFFRRNPVDALGVGSFGPIDLHRASKTFGFITDTPKDEWRDVDLIGGIRAALHVPIAFDTDVNAAALGEAAWGAATGLSDCLYVTVGTGVGGGAIVNGRPIHGLTHPEMGHIRVPKHESDQLFPGSCPFHGDCLEGLVSGPAIKRRTGERGESLPPQDAVWPLVAEYLASAVTNWTLTLSPQRVILGGGVLRTTQLYPMIRERVVRMLNGYVRAEALTTRIDSYLVAPALGENSGVLGGLVLARTALGG